MTKSSYCNFGNCVEVELDGEYVVVRDDGHDTVVFTHDEWEAFIQGVKQGEFDLAQLNGE